MKRFYTTLLLLALTTTTMPLLAQDIDETFLFVDGEYEMIENGATIIRNVVEEDAVMGDVIKAGIYVMDNGAASNDVLVMHYTISQIDNGAFQICFPTTCNTQNAVGEYATSAGAISYGYQDIQSEWIPTADGMCVVNLLIEVQTKTPGFPPRYEHKGYGPTLTIKFIKGDAPGPNPVPGDVNGDGEVNISDINTLIDIILSASTDNEAADVNNDGEINVSDVNALIDIILS